MGVERVDIEFKARLPTGADIGLDMVLDLIDNGSDFQWVILDWDGFFRRDTEISWSTLEPRLQEPSGYWLSWNDLRMIARNVSQTLDANIFALVPSASGRLGSRSEVIENSVLRISASDGTYWLVSVRTEWERGMRVVGEAADRWYGRTPHAMVWDLDGNS